MITLKQYIKLFIDFIIKYNLPIILFFLYVCITHLLKIISCPFLLITGIPCPGCGLGRAFFALVSFNFKEAFNMNPTIFILPFTLWIIIFKERPLINKVYKNKYFWIILISLVLLIYVLRMIFIFPDYPLEYFNENLINKIIDLLK